MIILTQKVLPIVQWLKSWFTATEDLVDVVYPVGSIYMSVNSTSPATLFGGTWQKIEGRFLLASGTTSGENPTIDNTYTLGDTDGSKDAVVVKHTHTQNAHTHDAYYSAFVESSENLGITAKWNITHTTGTSGFVYSNLSPTLNRSTHTASTTATNQNTGEDGTNKNMPPYLVVNVWKRTA